MLTIIRIILAFAMLSATPVWGAVIEIYPGESFGTAAQALGAGDTLIVHAGTYSESGRISLSAQGSDTQPIIIKGADGEARPLITRPSNSTPQNTINIEGARYLTIAHLEITGNGDGITMRDQPHHITLEDNEIHHIDVGINFRSSMEYIVVRRNHIHDTSGTGEGMYVGCNNATCEVSNSIIENNWIHHTSGSQGDGIEIKYGSWGNIIRDNVIHDTPYPCILAYGVTDQHVGQPNIIEGNAVWDCPQSIDVIADAVVRNNIVIGSLETQSHTQVPTMRDVTMVNNTVIGEMPLRGWSGGGKTLTVANNVMYGGHITHAPAMANYSANLEYGSGTPGIFAEPGADNYWPANGSPVLGAADSVYVPETDFNGTPRTPPFDVGAYEAEGRTENSGWTVQSGFKDVRNGDDAVAPSSPTNFRVE